MGYAVSPPPPIHGYLASVAVERARRQLWDAPELTLGELLSYGIAHEIGHLLLGTQSHSHDGLMSAHWGREELLLAARGQLNFTAEQAETIRADVRARLRDQASRRQEAGAQALPSVSSAQ
jgi:hypothetical protein